MGDNVGVYAEHVGDQCGREDLGGRSCGDQPAFGGTVPVEAVASMARDAIVFAMANPVPEVLPDVARAAGAAVVATGRSDFPNQINNVLAFPGVFRGALQVRATRITEGMKVAA